MEAQAATDALVLELPREAIFAEIERSPRSSRLLHELAAAGLLQIRGRHITVPDVSRLAAGEAAR